MRWEAESWLYQCCPLLRLFFPLPSIEATNQMPTENQDHQPPHFVLVPLMAQGHMIPMVDMACLLADRGVRVSFVTTPINASRIKPVIHRVKESGLPVQFIELPFPCAEVGLPEGCENVDLIPSKDLIVPFLVGTSLLREPLELYLREQPPGQTCMITDMCLPWTMEVSRTLRMPRFIFHGPSCFYILCVHNIRLHGIPDLITDYFEPFTIPDMPHRFVVTRAQSPSFFSMPGMEKLCDEAIEAEATADGVLLNSFDELEPCFIQSYQKAIGKKVWAIGPLSLYNKDVPGKAARGNKSSIDEHQILSWLDSMEPRSVVFVSFGSIVRTRPSQLIELGLGLEASNWPFIWVIKDADRLPEAEKWLTEDFAERTRGKGLIIKGWAPQIVILSHPAVGGFLTHCGWNSTLEAVSAGVPMITWPHFADQFLNEKLILEALKIGVSVGVKVPVTHLNENSAVPVKRDDVEKAVASLMDGGEEGNARRVRASLLEKKAKEAMEEWGSSYKNLTLFIQDILEH